MTELDHFNKELALEIRKMHGSRRAPCSLFAQVEAAFAHVFKVNRRREPRHFGEFLPRKRGLRLAIGIVVCDILAVVPVFKYIFHFSSLQNSLF